MKQSTSMNMSAITNWIETPSPRYLTQALPLEEAPIPRLLAFGVVTIACILAVFLTWSAMTPIQESASATGQVIPSGYVQSVQHPDGGIIKKILVEDGQLVEPGQILMELDNTNANADLGQMQARQEALVSQSSRLKHFVSQSSTAGKLSASEAAILKSMQEARASQQSVLREQIAQKQQELRALSVTAAALSKNIDLIMQENAIHRSMAEKGIGSRLMVMESDRELNQIRGQLNETIIQQSRARDAIREAQNRMQSLDADLKQDAMKNLGQVEAELNEVNKSIAKVQATADRTIVTAPVRGLVKGLTIHTLGAVVEPGKVLMEIVPVQKELLVEAMVSPTDIGHLKEGQQVKVKIAAFDFSRYGSIEGHLRSISASTFQTEDGATFYKIKVGLEKNYVGADPKHNLILPGMTVQADIVTGEKTLLQYLLKPIHLMTSTAFHEA